MSDRRTAGHGGRGRFGASRVSSVPPASSGGGSVTLTACSPATGVVGNTLTLTGSGFTASDAILVGDVTVTSKTFNSSTEWLAVIPAGVSGLVDVSVAGVTLADAVLALEPASGDTILIDTRAGGSRDIQAASVTTLAQAKTVLATTVDTTVAAFTTDFDGAGTHAFRFDWLQRNGQPDCVSGDLMQQNQMIEKGLGAANDTKEWYFQMKRWYGTTASGGGLGTVGVYSHHNTSDAGAPGGHKHLIVFRGSGNNARLVFENGTAAYKGQVGVENYTGSGATPDSDGFITTGYYYGGGASPAFILDDHLNEIVTWTIAVRPESAAAASDGRIRLWANGVLYVDQNNVKCGPYGPRGGLQVGGPTWRCCRYNQSDYLWDLLIWQVA